MPELVRSEVLAANDAWVFVPDDAEPIRTDDYLLVLFPTYWTDPVQVVTTDSDRDPEELVDEVRSTLRARGVADVVWWVRDEISPPGLEEHLLSLGGERVETLTVLAKALDQPLPPAPDEPEVRAVVDRAGVLDDHRIGMAVFEEEMPSEEELDREVERLTSPERDGRNFVAYLDGGPVGMGGVTLVDGAARLWGGGTLPEYRRRGVYAAVLRARLDWALEHGARFALTRGRVETSAPILRREGFGVFGEKRSYRIRV